MNRYKIRISAKGFFFNSKDEVLLVEGKRKDRGKVYYCAPGGGVEDGESMNSALERELVEETGYSGKTEKFVFCQDYFGPEKVRSLEVFFAGTIDESIEKKIEGDHKSRFISKEEFDNIEFYPERINPFELKGKEGIEYISYLNS